jgi:hypothetical protein
MCGIFIYQQEAASCSDALQLTSNSSPVMVVTGNPFYSSLIYIIAEGIVIMEAVELTQAVELLFGLHYVLNLEYSDKCKATYIFLQKEVLKIPDQQKIPIKLISLVSKLK